MNKEEYDNLYFIEEPSDKDIIGFDAYVDSTIDAINHGAKFIGLLSYFGNGKSTLIKLLKKKLDAKKYKFVRINLLSDSSKQRKSYINIHKTFLHQLIDELFDYNEERVWINCKDASLKNESNYYKKKINKRYTILDVLHKKNGFLISFLVISLFLALFDIIGLAQIYNHNITIGGIDINFRIFTYIFISFLSLFCIARYKPIVAIKNVFDQADIIDEDDIKDVYDEILTEYFESNDNHLIISLEEFDRYTDKDELFTLLKEFYKIYKERNTRHSNKVTFIIAMKPVTEFDNSNPMKIKRNNSLELLSIKEDKDITEKIFDYILHLRPLYFNNLDAITYELLYEKKQALGKVYITIPDNIKTLGNWKYLHQPAQLDSHKYIESRVTIRDIKHRYNYAISLYQSVKENDVRPNVNKCLFVAYLEDGYPELFKRLSTEHDLMNTILREYIIKGDITEKTIGDASDGFHDNIDNDMELEIINEGLSKELISTDYELYFYKVPKVHKSLSLAGRELQSSIYYDRSLSNLNESIMELSDDNIIDLIDGRPGSFLPYVIFKYPKLIEIALDYFENDVYVTIAQKYNIVNDLSSGKNFIILIKELPFSLRKKIYAMYNDILDIGFSKKEVSDRYQIRYTLCNILNWQIKYFNNLYKDDYMTDDEIKKINDINIIMKLTNYQRFNIDSLKTLVAIINKSENNYKTSAIKLIKSVLSLKNIEKGFVYDFLMSIDFNNKGFLSVTDKSYILSKVIENNIVANSVHLMKLIKNVNYFSSMIENELITMIESADPLYMKVLDEYTDILNHFDYISENSMVFLSQYKARAFKTDIREKIYKMKYFYYYVKSTYLANGILDIEKDKLNNLCSSYLKFFIEDDAQLKCTDEMIIYFYSNIDYTELSPQKLMQFVKLPQNRTIIQAVFDTEDKLFINKYLAAIKSFNSKEDKALIYEKVGGYKKDGNLSRKAYENFRKLTNDKLLKLIGARKK